MIDLGHDLNFRKELIKQLDRIANSLEDQNKIFRAVAEESKPEPVEKTCETCKSDPNDKYDCIVYCDECYDYSEWEAKE